MGDDCRVYSTPNLLYDIEMACRDLLLANIEAGKDSVGTRVELDHVGATLMGMWVDVTVTLTEVNGRCREPSTSPRATPWKKSRAASTTASSSASRRPRNACRPSAPRPAAEPRSLATGSAWSRNVLKSRR
jgi:hypothetical protein